MPDIPVDSPISYLGIVLLLFGGFLIVTGANIITIEKVSVTSGPRTWGAGIAVVVIGLIALLYDFPTSAQLPQTQNGTGEIITQPTVTSISQQYIAEDDFVDDRLGWYSGAVSDEFADVEAEIINGKYNYTVRSKRDVIFRSYALSVTDFRLRVEATITENTTQEGEAAVVLTFRDNRAENKYVVRFFTDKTFTVERASAEGFETLLAKTRAESIMLVTGTPNIFEIDVQGSTFIIFANGKQIGVVNDDTLTGAGAIGLGCSLEQAGEVLTIEFDDFRLEKVP